MVWTAVPDVSKLTRLIHPSRKPSGIVFPSTSQIVTWHNSVRAMTALCMQSASDGWGIVILDVRRNTLFSRRYPAMPIMLGAGILYISLRDGGQRNHLVFLGGDFSDRKPLKNLVTTLITYALGSRGTQELTPCTVE